MHSDLISDLEVRFSSLAIWETDFYKIPWPNLFQLFTCPFQIQVFLILTHGRVSIWFLQNMHEDMF